ncbi:hypothetical protein TVAG_388350 [Trichomonas vaginalis G3]|uniref:Uncharacterized protein n=1 Tax=Trichomonas vaginalis (strain ATCC PRA-98 / G3) TaxID=412133 RepID=A2DYH0_TRIV3|nr:hypothetical protein TVAGG3_0321340 [Trichomonas vaginalis G3]EAY14505.1 hypothetical protein TVAG_388350 [Trichomonas vaginalis G3]KAI5529322.1 hypothetical protein TVAGG3_0321340 [Trichomonas vaginalis G3]|eukprot:XP_001326728.1 hypothetical protein [Trichomonas vaginalis G3]
MTSVDNCYTINNEDPDLLSTTIIFTAKYGYLKCCNLSFNKAIYSSAISLRTTESYCINFSTISNNSNSKQANDIKQDKVCIFSSHILNNSDERLVCLRAAQLVIRKSVIYGNNVSTIFYSENEGRSFYLLNEVYMDKVSTGGNLSISYNNNYRINTYNLSITCPPLPLPMTAPKKMEHVNNAYKK